MGRNMADVRVELIYGKSDTGDQSKTDKVISDQSTKYKTATK